MTIPQIEENIESLKNQVAALSKMIESLETNLSMLRKQLDVNQEAEPVPFGQKR